MNEMFFYSLSDDDKYLIESTFLIDEINEVVWLSDFDKSPSLDDFPLGFLKMCWDFVKDDVVKFVQELYEHGKHLKVITAFFISHS